MKRKTILPMAFNDLEALPTRQLLARLKYLRQCEESLALSDRDNESYIPSGAIEFKDSPEWAEEYKKVKEILSSREHVSRGGH
jgi:hypothetical protein